jgi:stearoyl-CoA desaturase (Delta-9 desaturase)
VLVSGYDVLARYASETRSASGSEQSVVQFQAWCERAEASGIASLAAFSRRLRSYA